MIHASKSQPYTHLNVGGEVRVEKTADGLTTALDAVLCKQGGTWVAIAANPYDMKVVDDNGHVRVPEGNPSYTLRRLLLNESEAAALKNTAPGSFWAWCHQSYVRPLFYDSSWDEYERINVRFARAILEECKSDDEAIWLHDFHLTTCASHIRRKRSHARIGFFWHVPWPPWETFRTHPEGDKILRGMLSCDLIGFHLEEHKENFLVCCARALEGAVTVTPDQEIRIAGRTTRVGVFPVGVDADYIASRMSGLEPTLLERVRQTYRLDSPLTAVAVGRFLHNKGYFELAGAIDELLGRRSDLVGSLRVVMVAPYSGSHTQFDAGKSYYRDTMKQIEMVNDRFSDAGYVPITVIPNGLYGDELLALLHLAKIAIVVPLHDGMNLVSKEYVACNTGLDGVLVLSEFAGSAAQLTGAVLTNPFSLRQTAAAIETAISMGPAERSERMVKMRQTVTQDNVHQWAENFINCLTRGRS